MKQSLRVVLLALFLIGMMQPLFAQVGITVSFGPPALPVYEQPVCPEDGFLWTPGYWAYDDDDGYYWVPGTWVAAPQPGYLWTPAWWGWENGGFLFHEGYWATEVGFYGGINYGFGYFGTGFGGGRWDGGVFRYNTAVFNVNTTVIHNTYIDRTVVVNNTENRVSYNGGEGGITARPTAQEERVGSMQHLPPVAAQTQHIQAAHSNPQLRASANQGKPPIAATARAGAFSGKEVVAAKEAGAPYHAAPARGATEPANTRGGTMPANTSGRAPENPGNENRPNTATHASELQEHQPATPASTGNAKLDQKYQQQQAKLAAKQNQEHQKLQKQQEQEDQKAAKANNAAQKQQVEQRHQQQTQQLEQRHTQQQQQLQTRQAPRAPSRPH
ncbi:MAG TPA: YXWGXW repeat-containing protein [Terracidiphilus sp.]|jgi:hypothetical protein|nr:YXWGXW repeat-containing protein [Terracidiphilus sp.]